MCSEHLCYNRNALIWIILRHLWSFKRKQSLNITHPPIRVQRMSGLVATPLSLLFSVKRDAGGSSSGLAGCCRLQRFSDWPTEPPFRHGSHPPGETDSASWRSGPKHSWRYHSCYVVTHGPLTPPLLGVREEEAGVSLCVSVCLCV